MPGYLGIMFVNKQTKIYLVLALALQAQKETLI